MGSVLAHSVCTKACNLCSASITLKIKRLINIQQQFGQFTFITATRRSTECCWTTDFSLDVPQIVMLPIHDAYCQVNGLQSVRAQLVSKQENVNFS